MKKITTKNYVCISYTIRIFNDSKYFNEGLYAQHSSYKQIKTVLNIYNNNKNKFYVSN